MRKSNPDVPKPKPSDQGQDGGGLAALTCIDRLRLGGFPGSSAWQYRTCLTREWSH